MRPVQKDQSLAAKDEPPQFTCRRGLLVILLLEDNSIIIVVKLGLAVPLVGSSWRGWLNNKHLAYGRLI